MVYPVTYHLFFVGIFFIAPSLSAQPVFRFFATDSQIKMVLKRRIDTISLIPQLIVSKLFFISENTIIPGVLIPYFKFSSISITLFIIWHSTIHLFPYMIHA
jgi:hypothetical protein